MTPGTQLRLAAGRSSAGGSLAPAWSPDGTELFYRSGQGLLKGAGVTFDGNEPVFGTPEPLFEDNYFRGAGVNYDIHLNDDRFLMIRRAASRGGRRGRRSGGSPD